MLRDLKHDVVGGSFVNDKCLHGLLVEQLARDADVDSSFNFVAGEHPHLDACPFHKFDGISNLILQLVLYGSGADQVEIVFNFLRDSSHLFFSVEGRNKCLLVLVVPFTIFMLADFFLGKKKSSQTLSTVHFKKFYGTVDIF